MRPGSVAGVELSPILPKRIGAGSSSVARLCISRANSAAEAIPRQLSQVCHHDISKFVDYLTSTHQLEGKPYLEGNPYAVRIAAAAPSETAWEHETTDGVFAGALTEALCQALEESRGQEVSWRTTILLVSELLALDFPQQHPQVEGPSARLQFSLQQASLTALAIKIQNGIPIIHAGRVAGVRLGNVYSIMPFGTDLPNYDTQIAKATVTKVTGFKARVELSYRPGKTIPKEGALAFIQQEALIRWPVNCKVEFQPLKDAINKSPYLRHLNLEEDPCALLYLEQKGNSIRLLTAQHILIASRDINTPALALEGNSNSEILAAAEIQARGHYLRTLVCESPQERLSHKLTVELGTVDSDTGLEERTIYQDGTDYLTDRDRVYISLDNRAPVEAGSTIYISVFNVNVAGKVTQVSASYPKGIGLPPGRKYILGQSELGIEGLPMSWPKAVPRERPLNEEIVIIVTNSPVDLSGLCGCLTSDSERTASGKRISTLEVLARQVTTGKPRDMAQSQSQFNKYDVQHVPFNLVSYRLPEPESADSSCLFELPLPMEIYPAGNCEILTDRLPPPEATPGWGDFPRSPNIVEPKGVTGAITRWFKGIPPCVWVVNEHDGPITVVISKYRPNRLFAGGGLNVSPTGGGLDVNLTTFLSPATRKTLSPRQDKGGNMGVFPLWTRKEGFGVITIFRQQDNQPYIENDCIPAGAIASFRNSANLSITNLASSN